MSWGNQPPGPGPQYPYGQQPGYPMQPQQYGHPGYPYQAPPPPNPPPSGSSTRSILIVLGILVGVAFLRVAVLPSGRNRDQHRDEVQATAPYPAPLQQVPPSVTPAPRMEPRWGTAPSPSANPSVLAPSMVPILAPTPAPTQDPTAAGFHEANETWTLGPCRYVVTSATWTDRIGSRYSRQTADPGTVFIVVDFTETNLSNETITGSAGSLRLRDAQGRTFRTSSRAMTALAMSGRHHDLILSELQPSVPHRSQAAFEVPADVTRIGPVDFLFEERGILGSGTATVRVSWASSR